MTQTLFVVISICTGYDVRDCRVVEALRAPPGFAICSGPGIFAHRLDGPLAPRPDEHITVKCKLSN